MNELRAFWFGTLNPIRLDDGGVSFDKSMYSLSAL